MASEKNRRLINLVIALLATKKYLTKPQIFKAVTGYDGNPEAADRMFERDKEELRALGIEIEMKSIDPFFGDEIGYRIAPERYRFNLGPLTSEEVSILALAAEAWRESAISDLARNTALRLESLGIASDFENFNLNTIPLRAPNHFVEILEAIETSKVIELSYFNTEAQVEIKLLAPHGIYSKGNKWYLFAQDLDSNQFKSYRFDRISGTIKFTKKTFERESEISLPDVHFPSFDAIVEIRRDRCLELVSRGNLIEEDEEWQRFSMTFESEAAARYEILKVTPDIKVLQPVSLASDISKALSELANLHAR